MGETEVVVFKSGKAYCRRDSQVPKCLYHSTDSEHGRVSTIVVRGSSENLMDDIERAIDDGINTFKALTKVESIFICYKQVKIFFFDFQGQSTCAGFGSFRN